MPNIEPLSNETPKAYSALCDYARLGDNRSIEKLYHLRIESGSKISLTTIRRWSVNYTWQERIKAYQAVLQTERLNQWQALQEKTRQQDYQQGAELRALADKILENGPKFIKASTSTRTQPDGTIREVITLALDGKLMIDALSTASKLQRLATGLDTPNRIQVSVEYSQLVSELEKRGVTAREAFQAMLDELKANEAASE